MFEYTLGNHFRSGYDESLAQIADFRSAPEQKWIAKYGKPKNTLRTWKEECVYSAKLISESTNELPNLFFSGGLDSEIMVRSFQLAQKKFNITIVKYSDDLNLHDIDYALNFCNENKLSYNVLNIDPTYVWENYLDELGEKSQCISPQLILIMYCTKLVEGLPVIGNGNVHLCAKEGKIYLEEGERWSSWNRFFIANNSKGIPGFFQYTPEMVAAFTNIPKIKEDILESGHLEKVKHKVYEQAWGPLKVRPKYTGFENLLKEDGIYRNKLKLNYSDSDQMIYIPIEYFDVE